MIRPNNLSLIPYQKSFHGVSTCERLYYSPHAGFTLLELLLAVALSAFVLLVLAMGTNIVVKDWERSSSRLDDNLDQVLSLLQLERALTGAFPHLYLDRDENKKYLFFEGEEEKMTWVSTVSPGRKPGLTAWQILPNDEQEAGVQIRIVPSFAGNPLENLEKAEPVVTFKGYTVHFEYLYVDEKIKDDTKWLKDWSGKKLQSLPYAVRLRLEKVADTAENSLEMIALLPAREHNTMRPVKP